MNSELLNLARLSGYNLRCSELINQTCQEGNFAGSRFLVDNALAGGFLDDGNSFFQALFRLFYRLPGNSGLNFLNSGFDSCLVILVS